MSSSDTPQDVLDAISKLDASDQETVNSYISKLETTISELKGDEDWSDVEEDGAQEEGTAEEDFPPLYSSGDDFDKAGQCKMEASDLKTEGKWDEALEKYTEAVLAAQPSALLYANRAMVLLKLERFKAAERDCTEALKINPDSAKALRIRGKAYEHMEMWEEARKDLSASQTIDFDEGTVDDLKLVVQKMHDIEAEKVAKKVKEEEKLRKRAEEIRKSQAEAKKKEASESARSSMGGSGMGSMPGGMPGMPGGMPGMGGGGMESMMASLMSDPELVAAMQNPKVMAALSGMMTGGAPDPQKMQELMSDPEIGPVMQKLMAKLAPGMAGMAGGGMPGASGMGGGGGVDDDIPDMGDDDDDMPDLD